VLRQQQPHINDQAPQLLEALLQLRQVLLGPDVGAVVGAVPGSCVLVNSIICVLQATAARAAARKLGTRVQGNRERHICCGLAQCVGQVGVYVCHACAYLAGRGSLTSCKYADGPTCSGFA
jgi:hypothetical protein